MGWYGSCTDCLHFSEIYKCDGRDEYRCGVSLKYFTSYRGGNRCKYYVSIEEHNRKIREEEERKVRQNEEKESERHSSGDEINKRRNPVTTGEALCSAAIIGFIFACAVYAALSILLPAFKNTFFYELPEGYKKPNTSVVEQVK